MKRGILPSLFAAALLLGLTAGPASAVTCTPTGFYRDGINMKAALIATGDVSGQTIDATGCNIGIFFGPGSSGSVDSSTVKNANYFGIVVAGDNDEASGSGATSVDVTNNTISAIHDLPSLSGDQHGIGIYYRACATNSSATGTISGNTVADYQKGGIVVSCSGAEASISGNTVTGIGPTTEIAQNGIEFGFGATVEDLSGNTVSGNVYTQNGSCAPGGVGSCVGVVSTGILLYGAVNSPSQGTVAPTNHVFGNQADITIIQ